MTSEPSVSVIISTRNRAGYLPEVLRTLAAQQCERPFEVIVIDNGSSDETAALLREWCRGDPRFRTASEPRVGLSRGKNAGIRMARAPLLLFTDDDMRIDPRWIESYRRLYEKHSDTQFVAGGPIVPIPHDLGSWPAWFDAGALPDAGLLHHREERPLVRSEYVWGGNMAVARRVFDQIGVWNEAAGLQGEQRVRPIDSDYFEDTELQDRLRKAGGFVWFCPGAVVQHRVLRTSVTPRRVTSTAFSRGRNDFWQQALREWERPERIPKRNALSALLSLAKSLGAWLYWLLAFRISRHARFFDRTRRAAFTAGRSLDSIRAGRKGTWLFGGAARIAFPVRSLLLRLTPDVG